MFCVSPVKIIRVEKGSVVASLKEHLKFFGQFLKLGRGISTPVLSPRALALAACQCVNPNAIQTIIELGAGTGAITKVILEKMHPESTLLCIEVNPELGAYLHQYHKKAHVMIGDVQKIEDFFCNLKLDKFDIVISSLPLRSLPMGCIEAIRQFFHKYARNKDARFCQLTIVPWLYRKFYQRLFKQVTPILVWNSFPMGEVYICAELKEKVI